MNKITIGIIIAIIIIIGVVALRNQTTDTETGEVMEKEGEIMEKKEGELMEKENEGAMMKEEVKITMTADGFSPKSVTVKKGTKVTFMNAGTIDQWPATAIHPTHRVYPNSDIKNCETAPKGSMFDACGAVEPGASWSFLFNEVGTWKYHDHLQATLFGEIIVEE